MFLVEVTYTKSLDEVNSVRQAHLEYLQEYKDAGVLFITGRKNPPTGGVIITKKISRKELDEMIKNDPFYIKDVAEFKVIEFITKEELEK